MRMFKYSLIGGAAAVLDLLLFWLFAVRLGLPYLAVSIVTFSSGALLNYLLSIRYVFRSGERFTSPQVVLVVGVEYFGVGAVPAKTLAIGGVFAWNYFLRANFVFRA